MTEETTWPYSTEDEVSHLTCEDVPVLRARIDQLLEERRDWREAFGPEVLALPLEWGLTPAEERMMVALVRAPEALVVSKSALHTAISRGDKPETDPKIVDVLVCKVRRKLAPFYSAKPIDTLWARGYKLSPEVRRHLAEGTMLRRASPC